jgi:hypothetical protein
MRNQCIPRTAKFLGAVVVWALIIFALTAINVRPVVADAVTPRLPCDIPTFLDFPTVDTPPVVEVWTSTTLGTSWTPPPCTDWEVGSNSLVITLAGSFSSTNDTNGMLNRIGNISGWDSVRYWSITDKKWTPLFLNNTALTAPQPGVARGDFSANEIRRGAPLYFLTSDNRSRKEMVSQLLLKSIAPGRIVIETTNVTPIRWFLFELAPAGATRTLYFLDRQNAASWRFYSMTLASQRSIFFSRFITDASYVNRAVAMFRFIANIPTDAEPPVALQ